MNKSKVWAKFVTATSQRNKFVKDEQNILKALNIAIIVKTIKYA